MAKRVVRVPGLSYESIERSCLKFQRAYFSDFLKSPRKLDLYKLFESGCLEKFTGFSENIEDLSTGIEARTDFINKYVTLDTGTHSDLERGDPRARFTFSHEIGHIILHKEHINDCLIKEKSIRHLNRGETNLNIYEDSEWQADAFAAAFMMPFQHVSKMIREGRTVSDVMEMFGASYTAASKRIKFVSDRMNNGRWSNM